MVRASDMIFLPQPDKSPEPTAVGAVTKLTSKIVRYPKTEVDAYLARHFHINARGQETG
jgi:hypothetical protein